VKRSHPGAGFGATDRAGRATPGTGDGTMKTWRMAYWWFRIVFSGRFLQKFLNRGA
jgi:hypothetical protein